MVSVLLNKEFFLFIFIAYAIDPIAKVEDKRIPDKRIKANKPPINPPFILNILVLIRRINKMKTVTFKEESFKKVNGAIGFNSIINVNICLYNKNKILKPLKKKGSIRTFL